MSKCLIISGGEFTPGLFNSNFIKSLEYTHVYAADKGIIYAHKMGIVPDAVIGDFDSLSDYINLTSSLDDHESISVNKYLNIAQNVVDSLFGERSKNIKILTHPVKKDDTDTMLAIKAALDDGANEIYIICALGGRTDHTFANIQSLNYIASHNAIGHIYSKDEHLSILKGPFSETIARKEGYSLSLYSISDISKGLTIKGTLYEVDNIDLTNSFPLAYGNKITENKARISLSEGNLLIIESKIGGGN